MMAVGIVLLLGAAAALCLAAGMARHQRDLFGRTLPDRRARAARIAGWLLLALAGIAALLQWGWALGLVFWLSLAPLGALASVLFITRSAEAGRSRQPAGSSRRPSRAARPQAESIEP